MCLNVFENQGECTLKVLAVNSKGPLKCSGFIISKAFIEMPAEIDIDEADILVLSQELQKTSKLTFEINKSLKKIAATSNQSSQLFTPILARNNVLTTLQRNIESTLNSVASVKDLANEASKYEIILQKGINQVGLKQYTQVVHKLDDMLEDIQSGQANREENSEFHGILTHLEQLIKRSEAQLRVYFISILNSIKPFDPQINITKKMPFPYYEDQQLGALSWILDYFHGNSEGSIIQDILVGERSKLILKCMAFLEPFAKESSTAKNAPYEKGSSGMNSYTEALLGFIANEKSLVDDLYSQYTESKPHVLSQILSPLISAYAKLFGANLKIVRSNLENFGFFSFELVESINDVKKSLRGKELQNYNLLQDCTQEVRQVTQSLFRDAIDRIIKKANSISTIPSNNGVTEATVDTMSRLRKFSEYKNGCLGAMDNITRENWLPSNYKEKEYTLQNEALNWEDHNVLLSCFISDCIDTLAVNLERKAQIALMPNQEPDVANPNSSKNKHKQRIGFFILMNLTLVEQIVEKSELNLMLAGEGHSRLERLKKRYISYMVSDWRDLTANLMDSVFIDSSGKKSKDKEQIKEKFRKFNEGFEDLVSKTKQYKLSDPSLKVTLKSEIISLVMPMYERFYSRYKDSFKNPRKHIKYTPDELTTVLNQLVR